MRTPHDADTRAASRFEDDPDLLAEYEASKRRGFLVSVATEGAHRCKDAYWDWCDASNVPFMEVIQFEKYSSIHHNSDTTWVLGSPCFEPDQTTVDAMWALCKQHSEADDISVAPGQWWFRSWGIPNGKALEVATEMWTLMKPFFRTPEWRSVEEECAFLSTD